MTFNWGEFKSEIERLYMKEGKSLEEVRDRLKATRKFNPSIRAYKLKLNEWGYIKYNRRRIRSTAASLIASRDLDLVGTTEAASELLAGSDPETVKSDLAQIEQELKRQASSVNEERMLLGKVCRKRRREHYRSETEEVNNSLERVTKLEDSITQMRKNLDKILTSVTVQTSSPTRFASYFMTLEDAHGRILLLPLDFVMSWEMLDNILVSHFQTLPGKKKVQNGEFEIEDSVTRDKLTREIPWSEFSRPGRKIDMSMIFKDVAKTSVVCPKCDTIAKEKKGVQVECSNPDCKMIFRTEDDEDPDGISSRDSRRRQLNRSKTFQPRTADLERPCGDEPDDTPGMFQRVIIRLAKRKLRPPQEHTFPTLPSGASSVMNSFGSSDGSFRWGPQGGMGRVQGTGPNARSLRADSSSTSSFANVQNVASMQVQHGGNPQPPQGYNQMSPTTPVNIYNQQPYYGQDVLLPPHQQGILPQLDRQLIFGAYAGMDPSSLSSHDMLDAANVWDMQMNGGMSGFATEPSSAWFMPFNMEPPDLGYEQDIFNA